MYCKGFNLNKCVAPTYVHNYTPITKASSMITHRFIVFYVNLEKRTL